MITAQQLNRMTRSELGALLRTGHPISPDELDDTEYRGVSLGLPGFVEKLSWKTFKKVFHRDPLSGHLRGWNVRIRQDRPHSSYEPMMQGGEPMTFGHYRVVQPQPGKVPPGCDRGLLIHYGLGRNKALDPIGRVRDPIVAVNAGDTSLLLGWSYMDMGLTHVPTPSFFSLERDVPLSHVVPPPRRAA